MNRIIPIIAGLLASASAWSQTDTLFLSTDFTTHVIFPTDITYVDLSNSRVVAAKIIDQNKNMLAVKAKTPFDAPTSISVLESNGGMRTWIVSYRPSPESLILDLRERRPTAGSMTAEGTADPPVSKSARSDAPTLPEAAKIKQALFHIGSTKYDISVLCENIFAYGDVTYIVLSLKNGSGVSYDCGDATFVVENKRKSGKTVVYDRTLFPRSRHGSLSAGPGETTRVAYSLDKMTLSESQVLKIYFYENSGQRNLVLTIDTEDINKARKP